MKSLSRTRLLSAYKGLKLRKGIEEGLSGNGLLSAYKGLKHASPYVVCYILGSLLSAYKGLKLSIGVSNYNYVKDRFIKCL